MWDTEYNILEDLERQRPHKLQCSEVLVFFFFFLIIALNELGGGRNSIAFKPTDMYCLLNSLGNNMYA